MCMCISEVFILFGLGLECSTEERPSVSPANVTFHVLTLHPLYFKLSLLPFRLNLL